MSRSVSLYYPGRDCFAAGLTIPWISRYKFVPVYLFRILATSLSVSSLEPWHLSCVLRKGLLQSPVCDSSQYRPCPLFRSLRSRVCGGALHFRQSCLRLSRTCVYPSLSLAWSPLLSLDAARETG